MDGNIIIILYQEQKLLFTKRTKYLQWNDESDILPNQYTQLVHTYTKNHTHKAMQDGLPENQGGLIVIPYGGNHILAQPVNEPFIFLSLIDKSQDCLSAFITKNVSNSGKDQDIY